MSKRTLHALDFLAAPTAVPLPCVCVVFGDEGFLKGEVLRELRHAVLGDDTGALSFDLFPGNDADIRDVLDALATRSLFGPGKRLVLVDEADLFVSRSRKALEDYVVRPATTGILILDVNAWPKTSRLYNQLAATGLQIECKTPQPPGLRRWLCARASTKHAARLAADDADLLLQMVEPHLGLLDQELARLALLVGPEGQITGALIREHVGSWRIRSTWDLVDAAAEGNGVEALRQLDLLLGSVEQPVVVLAQMASTLRRFVTVTHLVDRAGDHAPRLSHALQQAGVPRFFLQKAERQLRQLGRLRGRQLNNWVLEADLAMKGDQSSPPRQRLVLEQLIARLSAAADPRRFAGTGGQSAGRVPDGMLQHDPTLMDNP